MLLLSTHDLTQRSTIYDKIKEICEELSTHDLTQRSTTRLRKTVREKDLSTHDLTQRSTVSMDCSEKLLSTFNSRPHAEVDADHELCIQEAGSFNSRPHAEVDLPQQSFPLLPAVFQLTTSRRGRHQYFTYFMQNFDPISYIFHKNHFK